MSISVYKTLDADNKDINYMNEIDVKICFETSPILNIHLLESPTQTSKTKQSNFKFKYYYSKPL